MHETIRVAAVRAAVLLVVSSIFTTACGSNATDANDRQKDDAAARAQQKKTEPPALLPESSVAKTILSDLRSRFDANGASGTSQTPEEQRESVLAAGTASGFYAVDGGLKARFGENETSSAQVLLPRRAKEPLLIEDVGSGVRVAVKLAGAREAEAQLGYGYAVYAKAHGSGATLLHRAFSDGVEDYLAFEARPSTPAVDYELGLTRNVAGLRLVENTLEFLDGSGTPRLRVAPPYLVGADGVRTDAALSVEGCAVDTNGAAPWGRTVTPAGAKNCRLRVSWNDASVRYPALLDPRWSSTVTNMVSARQEHTATLLAANGKILIAGGRSGTSTTALSSAELYDPVTRSWAATGSMSGARRLHSAVQLGSASNQTNGRVLVAGGISGTTSTTSSQLYNAAAGTWASGPALTSSARHGHTATLLSNGQVLVAGGMNGTTVLSTTIRFNPATGTTGGWTSAGSMSSARRYHSATLLNVPSNTTLHNRVLVVGGNSGGTTTLGTVQLYNATTNAWSSLSALSATREGHTATAVPSGVLLAGGRRGTTTLNTSIRFNPASGNGSWSAEATMIAARQAHTSTLLSTAVGADGEVLVAGGSSGSAAHSTAELWRSSTNTWSETSRMRDSGGTPVPRQGHTAMLLGNHNVLISGGTNGTNVLNTAMLYEPSIGVTCRSNSECATGFCVDGVCCDNACAGNQCLACNVPGSAGTCSPKPAGTACNDGNACTQFDVCSAGSCSGPTPFTCQAPDSCREVGSCNSAAAPPEPPAQDRIGWWKLEGNGTDSNASPHKLTVEGNLRAAPGRFGLGVEFDGFTCLTSPIWDEARIQGAPGVTMMAWVKTGATLTCPSGYRTLLGRGNAYTTTAVCQAPPAPNNPGLAGDVWAVGDSEVGPGGPWGQIVRDGWTHVAVTWDRQNIREYFNGRHVSTRANPGELMNVEPSFAIGCSVRQDGVRGNHFIGTIDEAVLYRRPLADGEILDYYEDADPCTHPDKADGTACSGGEVCGSNNVCEAGVCGAGTDGACLRVDGVVDRGDGTFVAVFGHDNATVASIRPDLNQVLRNGVVETDPYPAPPTWLAAGSHPGSYLPTFPAGQTITWRVDGQTVSASVSLPHLPRVPIGSSGYGVQIGDTFVQIEADLAAFQTPPDEPVARAEPVVGDEFLGVVTGELEVTPTGAANYSVPIKLPPGIAGMVPNLSLVYDSQGQNGIAGHGFQLAGLSTIHRCPKTRLQDGQARPVLNNEMDDIRFPNEPKDGICLDGVRLFRRPNTVCGITQGACYEPEITDYSRVIANRQHTTFKLVTKTGETRFFGRSEESRVLLTRGAENPNPNETEQEIAVWALDRVMDAWGNYYEVQYNDGMADFSQRGLIVTQIDYTGRVPGGAASGGSSAPQLPFHTVKFTYERHFEVIGARPDVRHTRFNRGKIPQNRRLSTIETPLGTYVLSYLPDTDPMLPSRLESIDYCAGGAVGGGDDCWHGAHGAVVRRTDCSGVNAECALLPAAHERRQQRFLEPLVFEWDGGGYDWQLAGAYTLPRRIDATYAVDENGNVSAQFPFGTQLIDINVDGRVDLVEAWFGSSQRNVWENTGTGFVPHNAWNLPWSLVHTPGPGARAHSSTLFADINGDGAPDLVSSSLNHNSSSPGGSLRVWLNRIKRTPLCSGSACWEDLGVVTPVGSPSWGAIDFRATPTKPARDTLLDMNGDGLADLVRMDQDAGVLKVALRTGNNWTQKDVYTLSWSDRSKVSDLNRDGLPDVINGPSTPGSLQGQINLGSGEAEVDPVWSTPSEWTHDPQTEGPSGAHVLGDIDGDGFYDSVTYQPTIHSVTCDSDAPPLLAPKFSFATGQGFEPGIFDAQYDFEFEARRFFPTDSQACNTRVIDPDPRCSTGEELPFYSHYLDLADLNGDGLADLIASRRNWNEANSGNLLVNTGMGWKDHDGQDRWSPNPLPCDQIASDNEVPTVPSDFISNDLILARGRAFVDLDGDGILDLVQNGNQTPAKSWLNKFRPPVIKKFPNGLARKSEVAYVSIASAEANGVYSDTDQLAAGTTYLAAPLRVVKTVSSEDGTAMGTLATTSYHYTSLRGSASGRGPQGFRRVSADQPGPQPGLVTRTQTTYSQEYPYTGLPTSVSRFIPGNPQGVPISSTTTEYCASLDVSNCAPPTGRWVNHVFEPASIFVYAKKIEDRSDLWDGVFYSGGIPAPNVTTTTEFRYDNAGNPLLTTVDTVKTANSGTNVERYKKITANTYGTPGSREQKLGKVTQSIVRSQNVTRNENLLHTTEFEYGDVSSYELEPGAPHSQSLALKKTKIEPGYQAACLDMGATECGGIEAQTAYAYDRFGNVITTTDCASDFNHCQPGFQNPNAPTIPYEPLGYLHPPFRTTQVSYNPLDFQPQDGGDETITALEYDELGRFPVRTSKVVTVFVSGNVHTMEHVEYTAHDPVHGGLIQRTDANGVHTCVYYDDLGRKVEEVDRCGPTNGGASTTIDYRFATTADPRARVVTVTRDPAGGSTFDYDDALGRAIISRSRGFLGGFVETAKFFDTFGRVVTEVKPHITDGDVSYHKFIGYDSVGRVETVTDQIGAIAGDPENDTATSVTNYGYSDAGIMTQRTVNGQMQERVERKNALGKIDRVSDARGNATTYRYDPNGNLTRVTRPVTITETFYDQRGRKRELVDPDLGTWKYVHDGFGDLVRQTDAKGNTITMAYDELGRMVSKTDASGTAQWVYDLAPGGMGKITAVISQPDPELSAGCTVPAMTHTDGNRSGRWFEYNVFGDLTVVNECVDGVTHRTDFGRDILGRQTAVVYPEVAGNRFVVNYNYTSLGFLHYLSDASDSVLWYAEVMNPLGQVTSEFTGTGVQTISNRNMATGWLIERTTTSRGNQNAVIQSWNYGYDEAGNLLRRTRRDNVNSWSLEETYTYDVLNRLETARTRITHPQDHFDVTRFHAYDDIGNITLKDWQDYTYDSGCMAGNRPAGPHAVCAVGDSPNFVYDANGNMLEGLGHSVTYNAANKPVRIVGQSGAVAVEFAYGAEGHRVVQDSTEPSGQSTRTLYVGLGSTGKSLYERSTRDGVTEHVQFIYAGDYHDGNAVAIRVARGSAPADISYYHFDHLGSVVARSNAQGTIVDSSQAGTTAMSYDAWGLRRSPDGHPVEPGSLELQSGHREFTGHEAIPHMALVNMNGRVYSPVLGRFLSPDPTVQFLDNSQSYNRYSYALNNPLRYNDPTGYFIGGLLEKLVDAVFVVAAVYACPATGGATCVASFIIARTLVNVSVQLAANVPTQHVVVSNVLGLATAGLNAIAAAKGNKRDVAAELLSGSVSGAFTTTMTNLAERRHLGENLVAAAAYAAAQAGSEAASRTGGQAQATPGARRVEAIDTLDAVLAENGITGRPISFEEIWHDVETSELFRDDPYFGHYSMEPHAEASRVQQWMSGAMGKVAKAARTLGLYTFLHARSGRMEYGEQTEHRPRKEKLDRERNRTKGKPAAKPGQLRGGVDPTAAALSVVSDVELIIRAAENGTTFDEEHTRAHSGNKYILPLGIPLPFPNVEYVDIQ